MIKDTANYEERLTTIANTRLIYNTMDELEEMLDNHSIHNNGIKRCFASQQKMRSAYRDLKVEVEYMTDWQIEDTIDEGCYFMTRWQKDSDNRLTGIRYALFIVENTDGGLIYYMLHPNAIKRLMNRQVNEDADQVWYKTEWLDETPDELPLQRLMRSASWQQNIHLTRCTDEAVISRYDRWLTKECEIVRPFQHLEYDLTPNLYAVTQTHLYIPSENEGEYYKIPRTAYEGFERLQIGNKVGTMLMDGKTYLAFDELMLYIGTGKKDLQKYGIQKVSSID